MRLKQNMHLLQSNAVPSVITQSNSNPPFEEPTPERMTHTDRKTLVGDVVATLMADGITINGQSDWVVDAWTILMVFAHFASHESQSRYRSRIRYIERQVQALHQHMTSPNAAIGEVHVDSFVEQSELDEKLNWYIQTALGGCCT